MNYSKIKKAIKENGLTLRKVCADIGMTEPGFHKMIREESMKVEVLEKIAKALSVNVGYFFDEPLSEIKAAVATADKCERCGHLEELLASKESEIELLKKLVAMHEGGEGRGKQAC